MANKRIHTLTADTTPDADAYLVLDKSTYAAPVKATVTQLLQNLPVAPQTAGGDTRGAGAVDLQVTRAHDSEVASGDYAVLGGGYASRATGMYATVSGGAGNAATGQSGAVGGGEANVSSGQNATVPGGYLNTASGENSLACGIFANADKPGQFALGAGTGYAQQSLLTLAGTTTDATPFALTFQSFFTPHIIIADDTAWLFRADVIGITGDAAAYGGYTVTGIVRRSNGTVTVHGVTTVTVAESAAGWDATAVADDTNKALSIVVTGAASTTIRWHAAIQTSEITYA